MTPDEKAFYEAWEGRLTNMARDLDFGHDALGTANVRLFHERVHKDVAILSAEDLESLALHHGASPGIVQRYGAAWALANAYVQRIARAAIQGGIVEEISPSRIAEIEALCNECEEIERNEEDVEYQHYGPRLVAIIRELLAERNARP